MGIIRKRLNIDCFFFQIGPLTESRWQLGGGRGQEASNIAIQVTPPDGEEDDDEFVPALRMRRKLSTPLSALPGVSDGLISLPSETIIILILFIKYSATS